MRSLKRFLARIWNFIAGSQNDRRLQEEMEAHIAFQAEENLRAGMSPQEAKRQARLKFGSVATVRESFHREGGIPFLENLTRDVRFAFRNLRRTPGFTIVAVLTLIVAIGGVTAVFSVVHSILLRPLAYPESERLVVLHMGMQNLFGEANMAAPDVVMYQHESRAFTKVAGFIGTGFEMSGAGAPFHADAERMSASMFPVLGVAPLLGRTFTEQEDQESAAVAVISFALWKQRFQSNPGVPERAMQSRRGLDGSQDSPQASFVPHAREGGRIPPRPSAAGRERAGGPNSRFRHRRSSGRPQFQSVIFCTGLRSEAKGKFLSRSKLPCRRRLFPRTSNSSA